MSKQSKPVTRLIGKGEMLERVSLSFPFVWQLIREGKFPASRVVGGKALWIESEIENWIKTRPRKKYKALEPAA